MVNPLRFTEFVTVRDESVPTAFSAENVLPVNATVPFESTTPPIEFVTFVGVVIVPFNAIYVLLLCNTLLDNDHPPIPHDAVIGVVIAPVV